MISTLRPVWRVLVLVAAGGATCVGCGDDDSSAENPQAEADAAVPAAGNGAAGTRSSTGRGGAGGNSGSRAVTAGTIASAGTGDVGSGVDAGARLSDSQIAAVLITINEGAIELGNLSLRQGASPDLLAFASNLVMAHTTAQARLAALLVTLSITGQDNPFSIRLRDELAATSARLQPLQEASYDLAYVESQIALHVELLGLLDDNLIPSVTAEPLRSELETTREEVAKHLGDARTLLTYLQTGDQDAGLDDDGGLGL